MFERTDVAAACCVAASMLTTGGVPSAEAVAAAHDELADGWARRARRLPARLRISILARTPTAGPAAAAAAPKG